LSKSLSGLLTLLRFTKILKKSSGFNLRWTSEQNCTNNYFRSV